jgi:hypothetical protein
MIADDLILPGRFEVRLAAQAEAGIIGATHDPPTVTRPGMRARETHL